MTGSDDLDMAIAGFAITPFDDSTLLAEAGLESLSVLRLAAQMAPEDVEIDAGRLVELRTVGDLKSWLSSLRESAAVTADGGHHG